MSIDANLLLSLDNIYFNEQTKNYILYKFENTPLLSMIYANGTEFVDRVKYWDGGELVTDFQIKNNEEGQAAVLGHKDGLHIWENVVEIFHETVGISTSEMATSFGQQDLARQVLRKYEDMKLQINNSFINGNYDEGIVPNGVTGKRIRKTKGIINSITTNVVDGTGKTVRETMETMMRVTFSTTKRKLDSGYMFIMNAIPYELANKQFINVPFDRNVGGMQLKQIASIYGNIPLVLDPTISTNMILLVKIDMIKPRALKFQGQNNLIVEQELPPNGLAYTKQIFTEQGIGIGLEKFHAMGVNIPQS